MSGTVKESLDIGEGLGPIYFNFMIHNVLGSEFCIQIFHKILKNLQAQK